LAAQNSIATKKPISSLRDLIQLLSLKRKPPNAALQRPGDNCIVLQVIDERHADSGPLQALVGRGVNDKTLSPLPWLAMKSWIHI
jgi:hypothetical protein